MKKVSLWTLVLAVIGSVAFLIWQNSQSVDPPEFRRSGDVSLSEMIRQPASYTYGSSINVFIFDDDNGFPREIVVLGHADSETCKKASGFVATALLQKEPDARDLFVAGAGRISGKVALSSFEELAADPKVMEYNSLRDEIALAELFEQYMQVENPELPDMRLQLLELEQDDTVKQIVGALKNQDAMMALETNLIELSDESGLVVIHRAPVALLDEVEQRIKSAAMAKSGQPITFLDLLEKYNLNDSEVAILTPAVSLRSGAPLTLKMSTSGLTEEDYAEAAAVNQSEIEFAIVGNARDRLLRLRDQLSDRSRQSEECAKANETQLSEMVSLNMTCTPDGCYPSENPISMTRRSYCEEIIPKSIRTTEELIEETKQQISRIEQDRESGGKIDAMSLATLVDSMLRDWELPVGSSQAAFDLWRSEKRVPAWSDLNKSLRSHGGSLEAVSGENLVFSVTLMDQEITVKPQHVVDLKRGMLIADTDLGLTWVQDTWTARKSVPISEADEVSDVLVGDLSQDENEIREQLLASLSRNPHDAFHSIVSTWQSSFSDRTAQTRKALDEIEPLVRTLEFFEQYQRVQPSMEGLSDEEYVQEYFASINNQHELLKRFGSAPPELELRLAIDLALHVARGEDEGPSGLTEPTFDFLNRLTSIPNAVTPNEREILSIIEAKYSVPAKEILQAAIRRARAIESDYVDLAFEIGRIPNEPSTTFLSLNENQDQGLTLEGYEAMTRTKLETAIKADSYIQRAIDNVLSDPPNFSLAIEMLDDAAEESAMVAYGATLSARERIANMRRLSRSTELLSRLEVRGTLHSASRLIRASAEFESAKQLQTVASDLGGAELISRTQFEAGRYASAIDSLFPSEVPLSLFLDTVQFEEMESGPLMSPEVEARHVEGEIIVVAGGVPFAKLHSVEPVMALQLVQVINNHYGWSNEFSGFHQLERMRVPIAGRHEEIRSRIMDGKTRLALLKAMVYGCAVPASDLAPLAGRCAPEVERKRFDRIAQGEIMTAEAVSLDELTATE